MSEPIVDLLETEWRTMAELGAELGDDEWETPTDLPGWTVKDNFSHVVGGERMLRGEPAPDIDVSGFAHVRNPIGSANEPWVEERRSRAGGEVLEEFRQVTTERVAELRALSPEEWEKIGFTPGGEGPFREFMNIRAFDSWMHEQDVRRATNRPGNREGPVADHALGRVEMAMGFVVGKRAAAPDGSSVVFDLEGPLARVIPVVVDGRAKVVDEAPDRPTVRLTMDSETWYCLGGGRWDPAEMLDAGKVRIEGDEALGRTVVESMNFMI